jgi:polysaccharide deacetylase 2 family uncharacterized protein YibQ
LQKLKSDRLFWLDSAGPGETLCEAATDLGCGCLRATHSLRATDEAELRADLARLREAAQNQGDVIATASATPALLAALQAELPSFRDAGVDVISASHLLRIRSLSRQ